MHYFVHRPWPTYVSPTIWHWKLNRYDETLSGRQFIKIFEKMGEEPMSQWKTPKWPVTWVCLLVDSAIATCLSLYYLLVLSLTQSLMIPLPRLHVPRLRPHHTDIANLLQDHISVHKHQIRHEYDYVAQTPLIRAAILAATTNSSYRATPPRWVVTSSFPLCPIPFHLHPFPLSLLGLLRIIPHSL